MDVGEVCELIPRSLRDITTAKQTSCQFSRNYRQGFGFGNSCRSPPGAAYNESQCLIKIRICWCFGLLGGIVHDFLQAASSVRNRGRSSCREGMVAKRRFFHDEFSTRSAPAMIRPSPRNSSGFRNGFFRSLPLTEQCCSMSSPTPLDRKSSVPEIRDRFDGDVERFSNLETGQTATFDAALAMS